MNSLLWYLILRPYVPVRFIWLRPKGYTDQPKSLGEHLLKRRMELGLTQYQVSLQLLTTVETILFWEKDRAKPSARFYPAIFRFLGFDPFPPPTTLPEQIASKRRSLGLSIRAAAKLIEVDEATFSRWESGEWKPRQSGDALRRFLELPN
jgi:DNA-binding transcriptional regulator YiaG